MTDDKNKPDPEFLKTMTAMLSAFNSASEKEGAALYAEVKDLDFVIKAREYAGNLRPERFHHGPIYAHRKLLCAILMDVFPKEVRFEAEFLFLQYEFVEDNFCKLFERVEGSICCADKSRAVVNHLAKFLFDGTPIQFDFDNPKAYWNPQILFKTHDQVWAFFKALKKLHRGDFDDYQLQLSQVVATIKKYKEEKSNGTQPQ